MQEQQSQGNNLIAFNVIPISKLIINKHFLAPHHQMIMIIGISTSLQHVTCVHIKVAFYSSAPSLNESTYTHPHFRSTNKERVELVDVQADRRGKSIGLINRKRKTTRSLAHTSAEQTKLFLLRFSSNIDNCFCNAEKSVDKRVS